MTEPSRTIQFAAQLLRQDQPLSESEYKEYRMKLEQALINTERWEHRTMLLAGGSFALAVLLMFVGGSRIVGDFDPWSQNATILSVTLAVFYCIAQVTFPLATAANLTRFRPRVRDLKEQLRDASILALHGEIVELRKQVAGMLESKR